MLISDLRQKKRRIIISLPKALPAWAPSGPAPDGKEPLRTRRPCRRCCPPLSLPASRHSPAPPRGAFPGTAPRRELRVTGPGRLALRRFPSTHLPSGEAPGRRNALGSALSSTAAHPLPSAPVKGDNAARRPAAPPPSPLRSPRTGPLPSGERGPAAEPRAAVPQAPPCAAQRRPRRAAVGTCEPRWLCHCFSWCEASSRPSAILRSEATPEAGKGGAERSRSAGLPGGTALGTGAEAAPRRSLLRAAAAPQLAGAPAPTASMLALRPPPATSATNGPAPSGQREL